MPRQQNALLKTRTAGRIGRVLSLACLLAWHGIVPAAAPPEPSDLGSRLELADSIKTASHARFLRVLSELQDQVDAMDARQRWHLRYLQGWEAGYDGDYATAMAQLGSVADGSDDPLLRFRAGVSLVNVEAISLRYDDAFKQLVDLLAQAEGIHDREALVQFYGTAAILYNKVGEYALATEYADHLIEGDASDGSRCKGVYLRMQAKFKTGKLHLDDPDIGLAERICSSAGEPIFGDAARVLVARAQLASGDAASAVSTLLSRRGEAEATGYAELIADMNATLASAYWARGDTVQAADYARRVVTAARNGDNTESLADAFKVMYQVSKAEGDTSAALAWHEKYMAADRGYLNEIGIRSLAYQKVKQQVASSRAQTEAAEKQNRILELQRSLAQKSAETRGLYALLITLALLFMIVWAWRLKRAEARLRTLAQRDSLTGIMNRQYFVYEAERTLQTCGRAGRDACLVLIDLDHFKLVNDSHGHAAGDIVLKRAVSACRSRLRSDDLFGRVGGEEFGVLMPDCTMPVALERAELLRRAVASIGERGESFGIPVSASLGVATTARVGYQLNDLMIHADEAMYRAKARGRNCVVEADDRPLRVTG